MKKQKFNVLIIDDHPMIVQNYQGVLEAVQKGDSSKSFRIHTAANCDKAAEVIENFKPINGIDLVLLDIQLPPSADLKYLSGEDLGELIRSKMSAAKIIVTTTYTDNFRIRNIMESLDPAGFLIKNDITLEIMKQAIKTVLSNQPFYSPRVDAVLRSVLQFEKRIDESGRKLLYELSLGATTKEIAANINLSVPATEKRKKGLKEIFDADTDRELLIKAKEMGFI